MTTDIDPIYVDSLEALALPVTNVAPAWSDVIARAQTRQPRGSRGRSLAVAAVLLAAVVVAPALAFSTSVRQFVGLASTPPVAQNWARATLTGTINHSPRPGTLITITWTIGEPGKLRDPGFDGQGLFIRLLSKAGGAAQTGTAHGSHGRYSAIVRVPSGGIRDIEIGIDGLSVGPTGRHPAPVLFPLTNDPY
jgi:hypothetical protein